LLIFLAFPALRFKNSTCCSLASGLPLQEARSIGNPKDLEIREQGVVAVRWFLIDRLEECEAGKRAVAVKAFSRSDLIFMDHFPGHEVVPGVLEIEMIAQTVSTCVRLLRPKTFAVLSKVEFARFIKPIVPGDQCRITAEIIRMRPHYIQAVGHIEVDGVRVGEAQFVAAIVPGVEIDIKDPVIEDWIRRQGGSCEQDSVEASVAAFA
jgi:3-hydroxyacyl-[acyl-carrier-protein] dehydratase